MPWRHRIGLLLCVILLGVTTRTAAAYDCYQIKKGTKLHAEVMGETVVGAATADVVGWFGKTRASEPTMWLRFVALDGDVLASELDVYVRKADATPAPCPASWSRGRAATVALTWPDARHAGTAVRAAIASRKKKGKAKHGRVCFATDVPGVSATVCVPVADRARTTCVAIPAGKPVFARASTSAKLGQTTAKVVAESRARVDHLLAVTVLDGDDAFSVYVRRADTRATACPTPEEESSIGTLSVIPPYQALLPDGSDAGFRISTPFGGTEEVDVAGRKLRCFDHAPVTGLQLRVCVAD